LAEFLPKLSLPMAEKFGHKNNFPGFLGKDLFPAKAANSELKQ